MQIKLVATDVDGVWTDGGLYYDKDGNELKKFNVKDGAGVKLLKTAGIPVCVITAKNSAMVEKRAKELRVDYLYQGVEDKIRAISALVKMLNLSFEEIAYIGDDFNDVPLLRKAGCSATPADASQIIQQEADWVLTKKGGEGVFREFVEKLLIEMGGYNTVYEEMIKCHDEN